MGSSSVAVSPGRRIEDPSKLGILLRYWSGQVSPKQRGSPAKGKDLAPFPPWGGVLLNVSGPVSQSLIPILGECACMRWPPHVIATVRESPDGSGV